MMRKLMPRVTLVIPCYDLGQFLDEAVDSALGQTYADYEILIVDDGSTDPATVRLLDDYRRPRARVLRTEHRGVVAARNLAIAEARGEYLSFFDADDKLHPEFLARTTDALDRDPSLAFASCWVRLFGDEDWEWRPERCDLPTLLHDCSVATGALVRREAVRAVGGFDPQMELGHEDWDLWITLAERGYAGTILPEVLFYYRRRAGSRSTVADRSGAYLELFRERLAKHAASYRANLFAVAWQKQAVIAHQLRAIADAERRGSELARAVDQACAALHASQLALDEGLEGELQRAHDEIAALRASWSWRVTGPLRLAADWSRRGRR
jgi:glycosyltransferase involved in cell wall biosynthesis